MTLQELYDSYHFLVVRDNIEVICENCNTKFTTTKRSLYKAIKRNQRGLYCSKKCSNKASHITKGESSPISRTCENCNTEIYKYERNIKKSKSGLSFCSSSCAATYNNTHKTIGYRRSKLEIWLEERLLQKYFNLEFKFNDKEAINSELDIYIPSIQIAFELNGIFHYEPIFGEEKLKDIQNNDNRKFQACLEHNIELCIIDSSGQKRFTIQSSEKYLTIISNIIDSKLKI